MSTVFFDGVGGTYSVRVDGAAPIDRHTLWIDGVGHFLRARGEGELYDAYQAAGFSTLSAAALRLRVQCRSSSQSQCIVDFSPTVPSSTRQDGHPTRSKSRRMKSACKAV